MGCSVLHSDLCAGAHAVVSYETIAVDVPAMRQEGCFAHTVNTVEPIVLRDSRSRCACAASFSG
jgi:hypothetical protein